MHGLEFCRQRVLKASLSHGRWQMANGTCHIAQMADAKILKRYNLGSFKGKLPERQKGSLELTKLVGGVLVEPKILNTYTG